MENWESAIKSFQKVIPFFIEQGHWEYLIRCYTLMSGALRHQGHINLALQNIEKAIELKDHVSMGKPLVEMYISQANLLSENGDYSKSIYSFRTALDSAKQLKSLNYQRDALNGIISAYEKINNFKEAYKYTVESIVLNDTIRARNNRTQIKELEIEYETEKKEQANVLLTEQRDAKDREASQNKLLFYVASGAALLILLLSFLLVKQYKRNANNLTNELKYRLLRNQMNPHFLFNALAAIQSFVYKNKPLEAGDYLSSFATLMRAILDNSTQEYISVAKELEWLENYLSLQLLRFDNSFEYTIHLDENITKETTLIPPMLIQPFIENALEHGLKNLDYKGKIDVNNSDGWRIATNRCRR